MKMTKALTLLAALSTAASTMAVAITGSIGLNGTYATDTGDTANANAFTSISGVTVNASGTGDYLGLNVSNPVVTHNIFSFDPSNTPIVPLWSFVVAGTTYSFDLSTVSIFSQGVGANGSQFLNLTGTGTAYISGVINRDPTVADWSLTATQTGSGANISFSFGETAAARVPDGGATAMLLGAGILGLGMIRRKVA